MPGVRRAVISAVVGISLVAPASALAFYGSIAVNPQTEAYAGSYRQPTKKAAERKGFWGGFGPTHVAAIRAARTHAHNRKARFVTWVCTG
jgi:hypothetical protein